MVRDLRLIEGVDVKSVFGFVVLKNVDFHLVKVGIAGLIGSNGAGKTTLFNVISGMFPPTSGTMKFEDKINFLNTFF